MTELGAEGLIVEGLRVPYYAGAMHYWRVPPATWAACLRTMHGLGFTIVETPVPWRIHEPEAGDAAWDHERDLPAFIEAARAAGLFVVLRVGPSVNAELPGYGVPDWVLEEPAVQARTSRGTPAWLPTPPRAFPLPSLASRAYHEHVRRWYAAVAKVVAPYLGETVVALGVDHAARLRRGAYDLDYHPDALVWWDEHAPGVPAPREWAPANASVCARWIGFQDLYLARAMRLFGEILDEVGFAGIATYHDAQLGQHASRSGFPELRRRAQPIGFEVGLGLQPWYPPLDSKDDPLRERDQVLSLLSQGMRGFDLAMAVEREQHYGAAISVEGRLEAHAAWLKPLLATLQDLGWPALRRAVPIAVIATRADERYGLASCVIDPMTPVLAELLGLGAGGATELGRDPAAIASRKWRLAVCRALELAQVPYMLVPETTPVAELAAYRAVIVPTLDRLDHRVFASLNALAEAKRTICVIGPVTPVRDELERPLPGPLAKRIGKLNLGSLEDLRGLAEDLVALAGEQPETWHVERPDDVRTSVFVDATDQARCVFVINDSDRAVTAVVLAEGSSLQDAITGEIFAITAGRAPLAIHARGVRMFRIA